MVAAVGSESSEAAEVASLSGQVGDVAAVEVGPFAPEVGWDPCLVDPVASSASCFYSLWQSCCADETAFESSPGSSEYRWPLRSLDRTPTGRRRSVRGRFCASSSAWNSRTGNNV